MARHLILPIILLPLLGLADGAALAQGDSPGCDLRWVRAERQANAGGSRAARASGYRGFVAACPRDSRVGRARAAARAIDPPSPAPPPPPPPPRLLSEVLVDPSGRGDTTTIAMALSRVTGGGTISVRPGTYREWLTITRPVTIRKHPDSLPAEEVLITGRMTVDRGSGTRLQNLHLQTRSSESALDVYGGEVTLEDTIVDFEGARDPINSSRSLRFALFVGYSARLTILRGRIGPGLSGAMLIARDARVRIDRSTIMGDVGYGAYVWQNGVLEIENSVLDAAIPLTAEDSATLVARTNSINNRATFYPIYLRGSVRFTLENNVFSEGTAPNLRDVSASGWVFRRATTTEVSVARNTTRSGTALPLPAPRSPIAIELGRFGTLPEAQAAWSALVARVPALASVRPDVLRLDNDHRPSPSGTFRMRATVPDPEAACRMFVQANATCTTIY